MSPENPHGAPDPDQTQIPTPTQHIGLVNFKGKRRLQRSIHYGLFGGFDACH